MTLDELMIIKKALLLSNRTTNFHKNAMELINREINLKTMNPSLSKEANQKRFDAAIRDSNMKTYGE